MRFRDKYVHNGVEAKGRELRDHHSIHYGDRRKPFPCDNLVSIIA